jgi:aspartate kinase
MIFHLFEQFDIQVNMIQSSAISFSASVDSPDTNMKNIINSLSAEFEILYNDHLELITIKNYRPSLIPQAIRDRQVLLEQRTRKNYQALVQVDVIETNK